MIALPQTAPTPATFGWFVRTLLEPWEADAVAQDMETAATTQAMVYSEGVVLQPWHRSTLTAQVTQASRALLVSRLEEMRPVLEDLFGYPLHRAEDPQFLIYWPGGFFRRHADRGPGATHRRVSVTVLIRAEGDGGELVVADDAGDHLVELTPGDLFAFSSSAWHEVTTVEFGRRFSVVSWYSSDV